MSVQDFARRLAAMENEIATLKRASRTAQLTRSSVDDGALGFTQDGQDRGSIGKQFDGATGLQVVSGPLPPSPTAPTLTPVTSAVKVVWDGEFDGAQFAPTDFSRVEVHASTDPTFPATEFRTLRTTIESPRGGEVVAFVLPDQFWYFRLVARSTSGRASIPSAVAGPVQPGKIGTAELDIDYSQFSGTMIHYGPEAAPPADPNGGDLWYVETAAGPPPQYEVRRFVSDGTETGGVWVALADQGIAGALATAAQAQVDAEQAARDAYQAGQVALAVESTAGAAYDVATEAVGTATGAANKASDAVATANLAAKPKVFRQRTAPADPGGAAIWYDTSRDNLASVWDGTTWTPVPIGSGAIAPQSLVAKDVLATGTITAGLLETLMVLTTSIIVGDIAGPHVEIGKRPGSPYEGLVLYGADGVTPNLVADALTGEVFGAGTFRSSDYVEAEQGWQIDREGGAEFANLSVPGTVGAGVGDFSELYVAGNPIQDLIPSNLAAPRGMIGGGSYPETITNVGIYNEGYIHGIAIFRAYFEAGRIYRVAYHQGRVFQAANASALVRIVYAIDAFPNSSDNVLRFNYLPPAPFARNTSFHMERTFQVGTSGTWYFAVMASGSPTSSFYGGIAHNDFSITDLGQGYNWNRVVSQYGSAEAPTPPPATPTPQPPAVQRYDDSFSALWARSWNQDGSIINDSDLYQGRSPYYTAGGNRRSMIGFDMAHIRSRLQGATIRAVSLHMRNKHSHSASGGTAVIGRHNATSRPAGFSGRTDEFRRGFAKGGSFGVDVGVATGNGLRDGQFAGFTFIGPNGDAGWYAYHYGTGAARPRLRVIYDK